MPTRTGKEYLIPHLCQHCRKYYSNSKFGYTCSGCCEDFKTTKKTIDAEFIRKLNEWVNNTTLNLNIGCAKPLLKFLKNADTITLYLCLHSLRAKGIYIRSEDALELLKYNESVTRGHVVGSCIADWWNIKTPRAGGKWASYLVCYYGRFDSPALPRTIPPSGPHAMLSCTNTSHLPSIEHACGMFPNLSSMMKLWSSTARKAVAAQSMGGGHLCPIFQKK